MVCITHQIKCAMHTIKRVCTVHHILCASLDDAGTPNFLECEVLCGMCIYFSFYNANVAYEALQGLHMQYHNLLSNGYFVNQIVG